VGGRNYTYSDSKTNFDMTLRDRIVILEDTDGDGRFDERTVFWDEGQKLTSVESDSAASGHCAPRTSCSFPTPTTTTCRRRAAVVLDGFDALAVTA